MQHDAKINNLTSNHKQNVLQSKKHIDNAVLKQHVGPQ